MSRGAERFWRELCTDRGLACLLPQSVSCAFSLPSLLGMWYSNTQLTHCLVSIPFYSCINLLLLLLEMFSPNSSCLPAVFSSLLRSNRGGKQLPLLLVLQGERKGKGGKGRDEAWGETWRRVMNSCCHTAYSSCPFGNSRKPHV